MELEFNSDAKTEAEKGKWKTKEEAQFKERVSNNVHRGRSMKFSSVTSLKEAIKVSKYPVAMGMAYIPNATTK